MRAEFAQAMIALFQRRRVYSFAPFVVLRPYEQIRNDVCLHSLPVKKAIFSFSFLPLELLGYAGATMTVLSFLAVIYQFIDWLRRPETPHGIATIIVLIVFFGSLNVLAISILGEYVINIFEEAKRKPRFIRKAVRQGGEHFSTAADIESFLLRRKTAAQRSRGEP